MATSDAAPPIPHDPDAERALAGVLILKPERLHDAQGTGLRAADIYDPVLRSVYAAVAAATAQDTGTDLPSLIARLKPAYDDAITVLSDLQRDAPATTPASVVRWSTRITELARQRRVARAAEDLKHAALHAGDELDDHIAAFHDQIQVIETRSQSLEYEAVHEAVNDPPARPKRYIDGMLEAGELGVLVAPRKVGKSWFTLQMALLLARGEGTLFGKLPVRNKAKVLVAHGELNPAGAHERWIRVTNEEKGTEIPEGIYQTFDRWGVRIQTTRAKITVAGKEATTEEHIARVDPRLERTIVEAGIDVLIIDPWAVFYQGKENSNDEMAAALEELRDITLRTGVAIWIVHHISKVTDNVRSHEDLWRGAGRLADWASTGVTMLPHFKNEKEWKKAGMGRQQANRYADLFFMRRGAPTDDFSIRWEPRTGWWEPWEEKPKPAEAKQRGRNVADVVLALQASGGYWPSKRKAADALECSPSTVGKYLDAAVQAHALERDPDGGFRLPTANLFAGGVPVDAYDGEGYDVEDWDELEEEL